MSSDNDSTPFLPKSLKEWLELITILAAPAAAIAAALAATWRATEGEVLVPTRLLLALSVATPVGFSVLGWYSFRRYKRLKEFEGQVPKPVVLSPEELRLLKFLAANDGQAIRVGAALERSNLARVNFLYHWHKLESYKLIDHVGTLWGEGTFMLSHAGRAYLMENGLLE